MDAECMSSRLCRENDWNSAGDRRSIKRTCVCKYNISQHDRQRYSRVWCDNFCRMEVSFPAINHRSISLAEGLSGLQYDSFLLEWQGRENQETTAESRSLADHLKYSTLCYNRVYAFLTRHCIHVAIVAKHGRRRQEEDKERTQLDTQTCPSSIEILHQKSPSAGNEKASLEWCTAVSWSGFLEIPLQIVFCCPSFDDCYFDDNDDPWVKGSEVDRNSKIKSFFCFS